MRNHFRPLIWPRRRWFELAVDTGWPRFIVSQDYMITTASLRLCAAIVLLALAAASAGMAAESPQELAAGNNAFALDLYAKLRTTDGNLFLSPYSISTCLAMVYTGARGDTAT